jgi:hypothetical protein
LSTAILSSLLIEEISLSLIRWIREEKKRNQREKEEKTLKRIERREKKVKQIKFSHSFEGIKKAKKKI